jgi:Uma2 family endonuclease
MVTRHGRATYADIERLPENMVGELIDGELFVSPRPASPHAVAASQVNVDLGGMFGRNNGGPGGWWIIIEPELHFGEDVLVPDLAGWRRERMPRVPVAPAFELAPDWICEVTSPHTGRLDRIKKLPVYARAGVAFAWLIDPVEKWLEVFRAEGKDWTRVAVHEGDAIVRAVPFDAVELKMSNWWIPSEQP